MLHCSECLQRNSAILLFSCRDTLKFSHCGQFVVCKMCKIIFYSVLHFSITLLHNIFPVIIIYCTLSHTGIQEAFIQKFVRAKRYIDSLTQIRITFHIHTDFFDISCYSLSTYENATAIGWEIERDSVERVDCHLFLAESIDFKIKINCISPSSFQILCIKICFT